MDICQETALRLYEMCKGESVDADPDETVARMALTVHEAMFRACYCAPRCESTECKQINGGNGE